MSQLVSRLGVGALPSSANASTSTSLARETAQLKGRLLGNKRKSRDEDDSYNHSNSNNPTSGVGKTKKLRSSVLDLSSEAESGEEGEGDQGKGRKKKGKDNEKGKKVGKKDAFSSAKTKMVNGTGKGQGIVMNGDLDGKILDLDEDDDFSKERKSVVTAPSAVRILFPPPTHSQGLSNSSPLSSPPSTRTASNGAPSAPLFPTTTISRSSTILSNTTHSLSKASTTTSFTSTISASTSTSMASSLSLPPTTPQKTQTRASLSPSLSRSSRSHSNTYSNASSSHPHLHTQSHTKSEKRLIKKMIILSESHRAVQVVEEAGDVEMIDVADSDGANTKEAHATPRSRMNMNGIKSKQDGTLSSSPSPPPSPSPTKDKRKLNGVASYSEALEGASVAKTSSSPPSKLDSGKKGPKDFKINGDTATLSQTSPVQPLKPHSPSKKPNQPIISVLQLEPLPTTPIIDSKKKRKRRKKKKTGQSTEEHEQEEHGREEEGEED